jgi:hypothetical protein
LSAVTFTDGMNFTMRSLVSPVSTSWAVTAAFSPSHDEDWKTVPSTSPEIDQRVAEEGVADRGDDQVGRVDVAGLEGVDDAGDHRVVGGVDATDVLGADGGDHLRRGELRVVLVPVAGLLAPGS